MLGNGEFGIHAGFVPGVLVAVETRKVAAGDLQPNAVAGFEQVARFPQHDLVLIDLARLDQRWPFI